jgi:hypothetical protein
MDLRSSFSISTLLAQAGAGPPWWFYPLLVVIGLVMIGIGGYGIATKRAIVGGRHQRFLRLFGIEEATGGWAVLIGGGQCLAGVLLLLMAITGPYWAGALADGPRTAPQPAPVAEGFALPDRTLAANAPAAAATTETSPQAPKSNEAPTTPPREQPLRAGSEAGAPFKDAAPSGGLLVGLRFAKGKNWGGALQAVQPIYQAGAEYALGNRHGKEGGDEHQLLARPGYAIGAINVRAGLVMNAIQVVYYRIDGKRLDAADRYESEWVGSEGGGPFQLDPQGKPITEVFGTFQEDLLSLGVSPVDELPVAIAPPTAAPPDLWGTPRPGVIVGLAEGRVLSDTAPEGGVLVGVRGFWNEEPQPTLRSLQPIYIAGSEYVYGKQIGEGGLNQTVLIARPGFRVGGFSFASFGDIAGVKLKFAPMTSDGAAAGEPYESPWIGPDYGARAEAMETGERIAVGLVGHFGETLQGLGLMLAGAHTLKIAASPPMPPELSKAAYARPRLRAGREDGLPFSDEAPEGGLLAGLICVKGKNWGGALHAVQPVYQKSGEYVTGRRHGAPGGEEQHVVARPGYALGAVKARAGLVLNAVQLVFYRIDGQRLDPADRYESPWVGSDGGGLNELDGRGDPITGIFGTWENDLISIGLAPTALWDASPSSAGIQPATAAEAPPAADFRMFTSADGNFTLEAKLLGVENGAARLERRDGSTITVPLSKLSQADVEYLREKAQ